LHYKLVTIGIFCMMPRGAACAASDQITQGNAMRQSLPAFTCASLLLLSTAALAGKAKVIPVPPVSGAKDTLVAAFTDKGVVEGTYVDSSNNKHGFFGTIAGNYTTFDYKSGGNTVAIGGDTAGDFTGGYYNGSTNFCDATPWERTAKGKIAAIKKGSKALTGLAWGMAPKGAFVGYMCDKTGLVTGYKGKSGKYVSDVTISGFQLAVAPSGINDSDLIVGWSVDTGGKAKGFILKGSTTSFVTYPQADQTQLLGINNSGLATGVWTDAQSKQHAFIYDTKTSKFTSIEPKNAKTSVAGSVNSDGVVALYSDVGSFLYCTNSKKCPKGGTLVQVGPSVHVPAGRFLRYENDAAARAHGAHISVKIPYFMN
jgi:hypothetical protein